MKKSFKLLTIAAIIAALLVVLCVSTFAAEVPNGANLIMSASISDIGNGDIPPSVTGVTKIQIVADGSTIFESNNPYLVEFLEEASNLVIRVYNTIDDYNDLIDSYYVRFDGYTSSIVTSGVTYDSPSTEFYVVFGGAIAYTVGNFPGISFEVEEGDGPVITGFFGVITEIMGFVTESMASVQSVFFVDGNLTMLGALSVLAVGVSLVLFIIAIIRKFLQLRG